MKNIFLIALLFLQFVILANNKKNSKEKSYEKFPYWVQMMEDPKCNYNEAIIAFELFWKNRKRPLEEKEILGEIAEASITDDKALTKRLKKLPEESRNLSFQYKKFLHWAEMIKPYVLEDGSILSEDEIRKINN